LQKINEIDENLSFKIATESNNSINFLDLLIHRNGKNIEMAIYRKSTETGTVIHYSSNHPLEHKKAALHYDINRMTTFPITKQSKQEEWGRIISIARNNGYPTNEIQNLKTKIEKKQEQQQQHNLQNETVKPKQRWAVFTYHSPLIRKVTNLFKQTKLKIGFRASNTIQQQLTERHPHKGPSGIYELKCNTCSKSYVGQSGSSIKVRYKEHKRYIRTNNPTTAYATHILENRHEYG
jgi:ribosomal 50S subunit-recycling heat shock protein